MKKSIKTNAVLNIIRTCLTIAFPLIIYPYISKVLGPDNLGKVSFASSVVNYFVLFSSLGIPAYGIIVCSKNKGDTEKFKKTIAELLYINVFLSLISYFLLFFCCFAIPKFAEYKQLLLINSISIIFNTISLEWLYSSLEDYFYITIRSIVVKLVSLPMFFLFVRASGDYYIYAIIIVVSTVGSNIFNFIHARKYIKIYSIHELDFKQHIKPTLVFFAAAVAGTINASIDTVMLGFMKSDYDVGIYTFGVKIKSLLVQFMTAGLTVMVPRLSKFAAENRFDDYKTLIKKAFIVTIFLATIFSVFFSIFSSEVIWVLGGEQYLDSQIPMIILNICIYILGFTWTFGVGVLQPLGLERKYTLVMCIATVVNVTFNIILIPFLGASGAALATLITESINAVLFYTFSKRFLGDSLKGSKIWIFILAAIVAGTLSLLLYRWCFHTLPHLIILIVMFSVFLVIYIPIVLLLHVEIRQYFNDLMRNVRRRFSK